MPNERMKCPGKTKALKALPLGSGSEVSPRRKYYTVFSKCLQTNDVVYELIDKRGEIL